MGGWTPFSERGNPECAIGGHGGDPGNCRLCGGLGGVWLRQAWIRCFLCRGWGMEPKRIPGWVAMLPERSG